jgi:hypothetical protein
MNSKRILVQALLAAALVAAACGGGDGDDGPPVAPTPVNVLRVGAAEGAAGSSATLEFLLENTSVLSGLQFDITFDPDVLALTAAAPGPRASGFDAAFNTGTGIARVVLLDLDDTARIATGDGVVATVTVEIAAGAPAGATPILVGNATAASARATTISIGSSSGSLAVR